jgi:hypothetical protein
MRILCFPAHMVLFEEILGIKLLLRFFIVFCVDDVLKALLGGGGAPTVLFEEVLGIKLLLQLIIVSLRC